MWLFLQYLRSLQSHQQNRTIDLSNEGDPNDTPHSGVAWLFLHYILQLFYTIYPLALSVAQYSLLGLHQNLEYSNSYFS